MNRRLTPALAGAALAILPFAESFADPLPDSFEAPPAEPTAEASAARLAGPLADASSAARLAGRLVDPSTDSPADSRAAEAGRLPVIIVTPDWQPVDAATVPMTIDTLSGDALDAAGIRDTIGLQYAVPGFVFKSNSVLGQPYLRGVGSELITSGAESSVATFVDGVYLPRSYDTIVDFLDVERVEVLKGPQAVQLGRNVVGGAVSVHTREPGSAPAGYVRVESGTYDARRLEAAGNLPLPSGTSDKLAVRLAGVAARRDGYVRNVFLRTDEDDEHHDGFRAKLLYTPTDRLEIVFGSEHHAEDSSRELGLQPVAGVGVNGGIERGGIVSAEPRIVTENVAPEIGIRSSRDNLRATWRGDVFELRSTTAYVASRAAIALDLDGTNADFAANYPSASAGTLMQELRFTSSRGRALSWTGGVFLLDEDNEQILDTHLPAAGQRSLPEASVATRSYALFGDVDYRFGAAWRGLVGVRYNRDAREIDLVRTVSSPAGTSVSSQDESGRWKALTPELTLEYSPRERRLYYLRAARGYKPGGFNTSSVQPPFDSEALVTYEAGLKMTFARRNVRLNTAVFHYDYENMQLDTPPSDAAAGTFPIVINAARSSIRGMELQLLAVPGAGETSLSLGATWLDAAFTDFVSVDPNLPNDDPNRAGNRMPQAPELSFNLGIEHTLHLRRRGGGSVTLAAGYRHQSAVYFDIYRDPALRQEGYGLLHASVSFADAQNRWSVELHGRNLTDTLYAETMLRRDPLTGTKRFWGAPRTIGLVLGYRW
jgi:iron complex outermembrane receptor protein